MQKGVAPSGLGSPLRNDAFASRPLRGEGRFAPLGQSVGLDVGLRPPNMQPTRLLVCGLRPREFPPSGRSPRGDPNEK